VSVVEVPVQHWVWGSWSGCGWHRLHHLQGSCGWTSRGSGVSPAFPSRQVSVDIFKGFPDEESIVNYTLNQAYQDNVTVFASMSPRTSPVAGIPEAVSLSSCAPGWGHWLRDVAPLVQVLAG